jgi:hypothetical protein
MLKLKKQKITTYGIVIISTIFVVIVVQEIMHAILNPFIAYLLIAKNYPTPYFIELFFLVFRGFVGPVKDMLQLSLICLMIRENIYH